jgi:transcriptional regulator with XRE-family HTH domain
MPHPKHLPVSQLFRLLREQLHTHQRDVAAHLGVSKQAVNNWAQGMSLALRYRAPFLSLVDTKIREALAQAEAHSQPKRVLLEMTLLEQTRQNLGTALLMWQDECLNEQGVLADLWNQSRQVINLHGKEILTTPPATRKELAEAAKQLGRVLRTLERLDTEARIPLHERWGTPMMQADIPLLLWEIYWWATGQVTSLPTGQGVSEEKTP